MPQRADPLLGHDPVPGGDVGVNRLVGGSHPVIMINRHRRGAHHHAGESNHAAAGAEYIRTYIQGEINSTVSREPVELRFIKGSEHGSGPGQPRGGIDICGGGVSTSGDA